MFSSRSSWSFAPNRLSRLLQEKRRRGEEILDLTESNPTRADLDYPEQEILAELSDPQALVYEPTPRGLTTAREAVARYYAERGQRVSPEDILLTASTSEAYSFLFKVLADPGDEVLVPRPTYPLFDYLAALESLDVISYPLFYDGSWNIDLDGLEKAIGARTRAVLAVHPANPTGNYLKGTERGRLLEICHRHHVALIVDEVFFDYDLTDDPERAGSFTAGSDVLTFVLSGLSKVAGLPQMKLSWIWTGGPEGPKHEVGQRIEHVGDIFLSVGAPVQLAAGRLLELAPRIQGAIKARITSNYTYLLQEALSGPSPVDLLPAEGGWYAVLRLPANRSSEEWAHKLLSTDNVYTHPGYLFDFPAEAHLVVGLLSLPARFQAGIRRLLRHVERTLSEQ